MRHIKSKGIFESIRDLFEDIEDICLELEDEGFDIFIQKSGYLVINAKSFNGRFQYKEVEDVVNRLKEYLGNRFESELVLTYGRSGYGNWTNPVFVEDMNKIGGVKINFNI